MCPHNNVLWGGHCFGPNTQTSEACSEVTCTFSIDNIVKEVKYNGVPLEVNGDKDNWRSLKTVSFESCSTSDPGKLVVISFTIQRHC